MSPLMFRIFSLVAIALAAVAAQVKARAAPLTEADVYQVQAVVVAQLRAFADDDADSAFATTTPMVRESIGEARRFLAMVRAVYPMVYRPVKASFHRPEQEKGQVFQVVEIIDDQEKSWTVMFALERQPDRSWRIGACAVTENRWVWV